MIELERQAPATEVPVKTVKDVLRNAARIIEERGWCQGLPEDAQGRVCADRAIAYARGRQVVWDEADVAFLSYHHIMTIPFNDAEGRTAEQVIAALREAANAA